VAPFLHRTRALMSRSLVGAALLLCGCGLGGTEPGPLPDNLWLTPVVTGLAAPVYLTAPTNDLRLFIVEQAGRIRVVRNGQLQPAPFLDITAKVLSGGERGLLGLAFHPDYSNNGRFYVNYTDVNGDTRIERYSAVPTEDVADPASASLVLGFDQPFANHNGGHLRFGPDGKLWIGTGDGGSGGDPQNNAQTMGTLLGKMLRIDVDAGSPYAIPPDNPFVGQAGARPEIWGLGLRNPWRYAFDESTSLLYVADVGQSAWEEVHVVPTANGGVNFGWKVMEGRECFQSATCPTAGLDIPVLVYGRGEGCSIIGGFVYRGDAIPGLRGHFLFSDYCTGFLRSFRLGDDGAAADARQWTIQDVGHVLSFGEDGAGEVYLLAESGTIFRILGG